MRCLRFPNSVNQPGSYSVCQSVTSCFLHPNGCDSRPLHVSLMVHWWLASPVDDVMCGYSMMESGMDTSRSLFDELYGNVLFMFRNYPDTKNQVQQNSNVGDTNEQPTLPAGADSPRSADNVDVDDTKAPTYGRRRPSLFRCLARVYGPSLLIAHLCQLVSDALLFVGPVLQRWVDDSHELKYYAWSAQSCLLSYPVMMGSSDILVMKFFSYSLS